jgi:hypothetical protein
MSRLTADIKEMKQWISIVWGQVFIDSDKAEKAFVKKFGKDNHKHYQTQKTVI